MSNVFSFISTGIGAEIDNNLSSLPIGYSAMKAIYEKANYNKILKSRFLEFMTFLAENKEFFREELFENEHFISGLALAYSEVMKQRFEWKRDRIYGIFMGFVNEKDKENFELERMYSVLNLISLEDWKTFMKILESQKSLKSQNFFVIGSNPDLQMANYFSSLGIVGNEDDLEITRTNVQKTRSKRFFTTNFGNYFIKNLCLDLTSQLPLPPSQL